MSTRFAVGFGLLLSAVCVLAAGGHPAKGTDGAKDAGLAKGFMTPPASARPWVYWFWLNGNITREGITADLEAMKRVGIGGVLIMEVDQGAPLGPIPFAGPKWRELFKHVLSEADRLGIKVNMNSDAGWAGSGGPWITPEKSMQKVVWSESTIKGPGKVGQMLQEPPKVRDYYQDICVVAFPTPTSPYRIPEINGKSSLHRQEFAPAADYPATPEGAAIPKDSVVDITSSMSADGRLDWQVPAGNWTIVRFGHTSTGAVCAPAPESGRGLENDKLSTEGADASFDGLIGKIVSDSPGLAGKSFVATHIDSWEVGSQNWTRRFPEEFQRLRKYDIIPFMPVFTGRVVGSVEMSERFLWDLRQTISELLLENYAKRFSDRAKEHGMHLTIEAYGDGPYEDMAYAGRADEPMAEFWSWPNNFTSYSCDEMSSASHVWGKPILGAESFTATDGERWQHHPATIKALGDWAFCEGINRFVFHRYAMQPFLNVQPGMSMGPWGLHYERTETWWEQSAAWHEYLSRCQFLLQKGRWNADICYLQPEGSPQSMRLPTGVSTERARYNWDMCPSEALMKRMTVKDGRLVMPDGLTYRVLVLPETPTMTPMLLTKIMELVNAGATVIGAPPKMAPGLTDHPGCDAAVQGLVKALWADCDGKTVKEHRFGKGRIVWGPTAEQVLASMSVPPDFDYRTASGAKPLHFIHKTIGSDEVYFVASRSPKPEDVTCSFRVLGMKPDLWWPETGRREGAGAYDVSHGLTRVALHLGPSDSVFVVFRPGKPAATRVTAVTASGKTLLTTTLAPGKEQPSDNNKSVVNNFTMAAWVRTDATIGLPREENTGAAGLNVAQNTVVYPAPGHEVYTEPGQSGAGFSVGKNGVVVCEHSTDYYAPLLVYPMEITGWTHVVVVYRNGQPALYLNGELARVGMKSTFAVHPAVGVQHTRSVEPFNGDVGPVQMFPRALTDEEIAKIAKSPHPTGSTAEQAIDVWFGAGALFADVWKPGAYTLKRGTGKFAKVKVASLPKPLEIEGPWELRFAPGGGAPESVTLDKLISWSEHSDPGVKYYSGTATYRKAFDVPASMVGKGKLVRLELGKVQVMARVRLNGRSLGTLWKPPYAVDVTGFVKPGENTLEVEVVNLWINRMIGDENLPEDPERQPGGTLSKWPQWVLDGKQSPNGRYTFTDWKLWAKDSPLFQSGLLGPVVLRSGARVVVK